MDYNKIMNGLIDQLKKNYDLDPEEDTSFNETNLKEKLEINAFKTMHYSQVLETEKMKLSALQDKADELQSKLYKKFRFNWDEKLSPKEITTFYIPQDESYKKAMALVKYQEVRVAILERWVKALDRMSWNIKTFLERIKYGY